MTSPNILIVEDEPLIALDIESTVTAAGFSVAGIARDLRGALEIMERARLDVAILDANLDGRSAAPIADELSAANIPFIVISGYARSQLGSWVDSKPLLGKPYPAKRLIAEIARLVSPP